jgi:hypothetical protein
MIPLDDTPISRIKNNWFDFRFHLDESEDVRIFTQKHLDEALSSHSNLDDAALEYCTRVIAIAKTMGLDIGLNSARRLWPAVDEVFGRKISDPTDLQIRQRIQAFISEAHPVKVDELLISNVSPSEDGDTFMKWTSNTFKMRHIYLSDHPKFRFSSPEMRRDVIISGSGKDLIWPKLELTLTLAQLQKEEDIDSISKDQFKEWILRSNLIWSEEMENYFLKNWVKTQIAKFPNHLKVSLVGEDIGQDLTDPRHMLLKLMDSPRWQCATICHNADHDTSMNIYFLKDYGFYVQWTSLGVGGTFLTRALEYSNPCIRLDFPGSNYELWPEELFHHEHHILWLLYHLVDDFRPLASFKWVEGQDFPRKIHTQPLAVKSWEKYIAYEMQADTFNPILKNCGLEVIKVLIRVSHTKSLGEAANELNIAEDQVRSCIEFACDILEKNSRVRKNNDVLKRS